MALGVGVLGFAGPEAALAGPDPSGQCLTADAPAITEPAIRCGSAPAWRPRGRWARRREVDPVDVEAQDAALQRLEPPRRTLVIRLSRMFMSDGRAAIASLARRARHFTQQGFKVEAQVRYHPSEEQEGRMGLWRKFVRQAVRKLGRNDDLVALTITNEINLPLSPNTSDGAFEKAVKAILVGLPTARHTLREIGREDVALGFSYAYRYLPEEDNKFWQRLGDEGTPRFRRAVDYVGLQLYPGLFWPPTLVTQTAGEATVEAITLLRRCWMPRAKLADSARIWITENGYATNLGHTEERQWPSSPTRYSESTSTPASSTSPTTAISTCATTGPTGPTSSTTSASFVRTTRASRRSGPTASSWASWGNSRPRLAAADNGMSHFGPICERSEE